MKRIDSIRINILKLFVFLLPFEYWDPFGITSFFTITKFVGLLYAILSLCDFKRAFSATYIKRPLILLVSLWFFMLLVSVMYHKKAPHISVFNFTFLQNIVLFWLVSNDLIRNKELVNEIFISLILGVLLMGILLLLGIGIELDVADLELGSYRISFFGSNSNSVGNIAAVALFLVLQMTLDFKNYFGKKTFLLLVTIPLLLNLIILSASRGAAIITLSAIIVLFLFRKTKPLKKITFLVLGTMIIWLVINSFMTSELMSSRLLASSESEMGGRLEIWYKCIEIFSDSPFWGCGVTGYYYEIIKKLGIYLDPHNLLLYFMTTTGFVGTVLYIGFVIILVKSAFKYYKTYKETILIGLFIIYFLLSMKSGGAINSKLLWTLTAIIYGHSNTMDRKNDVNIISEKI